MGAAGSGEGAAGGVGAAGSGVGAAGGVGAEAGGSPPAGLVARARARSQWLHAPGGDDVVRHLLAVQAQDVASVPYALEARGGALRDGLLVTWLMRSTLHLVDADDLAWLHPLFAPRMVAANTRRLKQLGVTEDHTDAIVAAAPITRAELGERLNLTGQALPHVIWRAAIAGRIALTPAERLIVPLHLPPPPDRDASLGELARRYYAAHAGADARDLAYWSGLPLRDCRPPARSRIEDGAVPDVLIPALDELLLGWRDRTPTVPEEHAKVVHPGGGIIRAVALEAGVAVGTWTRRGGVQPF